MAWYPLTFRLIWRFPSVNSSRQRLLLTRRMGIHRVSPRPSRSWPPRRPSSSAVQFTAPTYLVTESGVAAVVVVSRVGSTAGTAMVDYSTVDGSAKAGTDYTSESGTLTFNDGEASKTLTIPIQDNAVAAPDTSFGIILSNAAGVSLGSTAATSVTIADDDSAGQIAFLDNGVTFDESDVVPPLVVTRTGGSKGRVTVGYTVTGGTATPFVLGDNSLNTDYRDFFGTLDFEDGQTTAEIPITTFDEELFPNNTPGPVFEGPETIDVSLGNPTGGATLGLDHPDGGYDQRR